MTEQDDCECIYHPDSGELYRACELHEDQQDHDSLELMAEQNSVYENSQW